MAYEFKTTRQVEFADTDMAGIVHFSAFFRYMENAEHAFYRSLGYSVQGKSGESHYGWPRVHAECDFVAPLRFEETVEIHLLVARKGESSMTFQFVFHKRGPTPAPPVLVARGLVTAVYVTANPQTGKMKKAAIPAELSKKIETAPPALLHAGDDHGEFEPKHQ